MDEGRWWEDMGHRKWRRVFIRLFTLAAFAGVLAILALQVAGVGDANDNVNGFTVGLLLLAIVLGFALITPTAVKELLDRVTTFSFGGVELGLQAAERLDLLQTPLTGDADELNSLDDVNPTEDRPRGGGALREYAAVQEKLQERLRYVRDVILGLDKDLSYVQIVEKINGKELIGHLELRVLYDLLGRAEKGIEQLPDGELDRYLNRAWRFSTRFGTLVFERDVRKRLIRKGWFLIDFEQSRKHRPDFLAYKRPRSRAKGQEASKGGWLLIATRVQPNLTRRTVARLQKERPPFGAKRVVVVPDSRGRLIKDVEGATAVRGREAVLIKAAAGKAWMVTLSALLGPPRPRAR